MQLTVIDFDDLGVKGKESFKVDIDFKSNTGYVIKGNEEYCMILWTPDIFKAKTQAEFLEDQRKAHKILEEVDYDYDKYVEEKK